MKINNPFIDVDDGFTLIEVLIAMVILTIGIFALYSMQISSIRGNHLANLVTQSSNFSSLQLERALSADFDGSTLEDRNNNGTKKDLDKDSIDDAGKNFGLDDVGDDADYQINSGDNNYTIAYNVALDVPLEGIKKIRVHTRSNANVMQNAVTFDLLKNEGI